MFSRQFLRFVIVGSIGFVVDAVILLSLTLVLDPYLARIASFLVAVLVTWRLNISYTFGRQGRGLTAYLSGQSAGLLINYGVYSLTLWLIRGMHADALLALVAGSLVALAFNYASMRKWIFADTDP